MIICNLMQNSLMHFPRRSSSCQRQRCEPSRCRDWELTIQTSLTFRMPWQKRDRNSCLMPAGPCHWDQVEEIACNHLGLCPHRHLAWVLWLHRTTKEVSAVLLCMSNATMLNSMVNKNNTILENKIKIEMIIHLPVRTEREIAFPEVVNRLWQVFIMRDYNCLTILKI